MRMSSLFVLLGIIVFLLESEVNALVSMRKCRSFTTKIRMSTSLDSSSYHEIVESACAGLKAKVKSGEAPEALVTQVTDFLTEYAESNEIDGTSHEFFKENVGVLLKSVKQAMTDPYKFSPNHKAIREPYDFYKWGNDFLRPLIIMKESKIFDAEICSKIEAILAKGENVVILSNHQTEADPQVLSILLEKAGYSSLAERMIFIAGHKVTNDPVAIPFSMGRNLLCIHSKKHIKNPPEMIPIKQAQNLESMKAMGHLASEGGNVFWVAPSGGRDRPDMTGEFVVAPFDFKALDMFKLVGMQSGKPIHFFPMAMYTHRLIPPPETTESSLGEKRSAKRGAVSVKFLPETNGIGGLKDKDFTMAVQNAVADAYGDLVKFHASQASKA